MSYLYTVVWPYTVSKIVVKRVIIVLPAYHYNKRFNVYGKTNYKVMRITYYIIRSGYINYIPTRLMVSKIVYFETLLNTSTQCRTFQYLCLSYLGIIINQEIHRNDVFVSFFCDRIFGLPTHHSPSCEFFTARDK